jgi:hypothetical protein
MKTISSSLIKTQEKIGGKKFVKDRKKKNHYLKLLVGCHKEKKNEK